MDPGTGRGVLPAPLEVLGQYGCVLDGPATGGGVVSGSVALAAWFGPAVVIELAGEGGTLAQVLAWRDADMGTYPFSLRLPSLVPVNRTLRLQLRVGGVAAR